VLIVTCRVETYRHVLSFVLVDEEHETEQDPLGIEGGIGRPVGTDNGGGQLLPLDLMQHHHLGAGSSSNSSTV